MAKFERKWVAFGTSGTANSGLYKNANRVLSTKVEDEEYKECEKNHNTIHSRSSNTDSFNKIQGGQSGPRSPKSLTLVRARVECECQPLIGPLQTGPVCQQCGFKIWCSSCGGCRSCWVERTITTGGRSDARIKATPKEAFTAGIHAAH